MLAIALLNAALPPAIAAAYWVLRKARQSALARCYGEDAPQSAFNAAWAGEAFSLDARCE